MELPSTTRLPSPMSFTTAPPTADTAAPSEPVSDACMQMALGRMCEARYLREMESLHSTASWYGTVYAVLVITFYVVFCLVLLLRSRTSLSYSARGNLQACRVVSRPPCNRRAAARDVTNDSSFSTESALMSEPSCSSQAPSRPRSTAHP
ncbi:uncharacterized protein LOC122382608 [Amphibalanus amphitrite]|uniref:uncharacterized protein LOC122366853 n=1 Tax=Amphibalanus amphitrite TaxID=1232801 RepID=UPI001C910EED|nr:uncharacterized protein LOC122366853 [Amphibalanus amphitrite]XP_043224100.1 uncharacterized protein LOC122382608 [Amphibalanus amphitrite]